jgi:hypothetical protein
LTTAVQDRFGDSDVRRSEVVAEFGEPSLVVDRRVLCYVPTQSTGWAFVDCWAESQTTYAPGKGSFEVNVDDDPLVREFRLPAEDFESNGTGKSSLYRALRLLADASRNGAVAALAREGGFPVDVVGRAGVHRRLGPAG